MTEEKYYDLSMKHINESKEYNIKLSDVAFDIICFSEKYTDADVVETISKLPGDILEEIEKKLLTYNKTGEYYSICNLGVFDATSIFERLSNLKLFY